MAGFRYEDLIKNKRYAIAQVFKHVGLPLDLVESGLKAMEGDSQKGSGVGSKEVCNYSDLPFTPEVEARARKIFTMFNLPAAFIDEAHLEGTISGESS